MGLVMGLMGLVMGLMGLVMGLMGLVMGLMGLVMGLMGLVMGLMGLVMGLMIDTLSYLSQFPHLVLGLLNSRRRCPWPLGVGSSSGLCSGPREGHGHPVL